MEKHGISEAIETYLSQNKIASSQIAKELDISEDKILGRNGESMLASEFLELCRYLNIEPEQFRMK